ncbi:hypothetical protein DIPPA_01638 [Diplonema papillatum]|nr:hypothetical protein DIPPA_01638 [Diplonema papillatum]
MGCTDSKPKQPPSSAKATGGALQVVPTGTKDLKSPKPAQKPPPKASSLLRDSKPAREQNSNTAAKNGKLDPCSPVHKSPTTGARSPRSPRSPCYPVEPIHVEASATVCSDPEASVLSPTVATPRHLARGRLVLYAHPVSQPSRSVEWYFYYAKKPFKLQLVDLVAGEQNSSKFRALTPTCTVPFLTDGENLSLSESSAILKHLSAEDKTLAPIDAKEAAKIDEYIGRHHSLVRNLTTACFAPTFFAFCEDRPTIASEGLSTVRPILDVFEATLQSQDFIALNHLSIADFLFATEVDGLDYLMLLDEYPKIRSYLGRMRDIGGYERTNETFLEICDKLCLKPGMEPGEEEAETPGLWKHKKW